MAIPNARNNWNDDPDFASAAFYNLHFLGLSDPSRFNAKLANAQYLVDKYRIVGFSELHRSSAVAEDSFFSHLRGVYTVYHCCPDFGGMALCVSRKLLSDLGISDLAGLETHHKIFVANAAHGIWYDVGSARRLYLNMYLDSHSSARRAEQLVAIRQSIDSFRAASPSQRLEVVFGGDRNFVTDVAQYDSSIASSWHPGGTVLDAWGDLLESLGAGHSGELGEHTFRRSGTLRDGARWWISETLDFARVGCDYLRHAHRQQYVHIVRNVPHAHASDHLPVAVSFDGWKRSVRKPPQNARVNIPLPDWLVYDVDFLRGLSDAVH